MRRGTALLVGAAVIAAARLVPASGDTAPAPDVPRDVCTHEVTDPFGDAKAVSASTPADVPVVATNVAGLDIQAVDLRLTDTDFQVFLGITHFANPPQMASYEAAWRYKVSFKLDGKTFNWGAQQHNATESQLEPTDTGAWEPNGNNYIGTGGGLGGATVQFVPGGAPPLSWVVWSVKRSVVDTGLGQPLQPGDVATAVTASTEDWSTAHQLPGGDSLSSSLTAAQDQLVVGDDWCFGAPPTALSALTVPAVTRNHPETVSAVLNDENNKPLAGQPVTFAVTGTNLTATGTTDANGLAKATFPSVGLTAGSYQLVAQFPGQGTTYKASSVTGTLVVAAQKTAFSALKIAKSSATTRTVTATLLDDLKKPVAGVKVDWYVNGKKTTTTTTDRTGKTVLRGGKPGQKVQAKFAGKAGYWLAAVSAIVKVT